MNNIAKKSVKKIYGCIETIKNKAISKSAYCQQLEKQNHELEQRLEWFINHAEITALKPATGYLRHRQLDALQFAEEFFLSIEALNIKPFLVFGNLLGAYRHKGYIPWDDDLDFGLIREDYNKLIDYCKQHFYVEIYDGKWSEYSSDKHIERMDQAVKAHPNEYILDIWVDQIQITRGTSCIDRMAIDFWAYDYYTEDYSIDEHINYLKSLDKKRREIDYIDKIVGFLDQEIKKNDSISKKPTSKVFPGIDNLEGYSLLRLHRINDWLSVNDLYPMRSVQYEYTTYYAPRNIEHWLEFDYPDYMSFPSDVGVPRHMGYKDKYILEHMPTVEFYLIDAFEIYHFLPFYHYFEKNGIYSTFIAEPPEINTSKEWFDYDTAIHVLEINGVRYQKKANFDVDFVFTTQDEYLVNGYKGKKVHVPYGMNLNPYSFCESKRSIDGFDIKLVHGEYSYQNVKKLNSKIQIIRMGYPKYSVGKEQEYLYDSQQKKQEIKERNIYHKPILLYFPTWNSISTIDTFAPQISALREQFFIVTKVHHCTERLKSESEHRKILNEISDVVLEGNFSFKEAALLGDIAICDAISGAATEVPYLNPNIKLVLLFCPVEKHNQYVPFIEDYAVCIKNPADLVQNVKNIYDNDLKQTGRNTIMRSLYEAQSETAFDELKELILEYHRDKSNVINKTKTKFGSNGK